MRSAMACLLVLSLLLGSALTGCGGNGASGDTDISVPDESMPAPDYDPDD